MSCVLTLASAAIIAGATISTTGLTALLSNISDEEALEETGIDTMFVDGELLTKTLSEFGCCVDSVSEDCISVTTSCGNLRYIRSAAGQPYKMYLDEISDPQQLLEELRSLEQDYGKNVQSYTYSHIKDNLTSDMTVQSEEFLEDDSVLLTISVE